MRPRPQSTEKSLFVTGSNAAFFPMLCQLLSSFERFALGEKLMVCDFGLTEGQAAFLAEKNILLPRPAILEPGWHPYLYKGCLYSYVETIPFDLLTWIDSDCILTGLFADEVYKVAAQYGPDQPFIAITQDIDNNTIGSFIEKNPEKTQPFDQVVTAYQLPRDKAYLNCGLFTIRSRQTLKEWAELTRTLPPHFLFEQNTFNAVVYKNIQQVVLWDWVVFNVCGSALNDLQVIGGGRYPGSVRLGETAIIVTHVAATTQQAALSFEPLILPIGEGFLCGLFRFPHNPALNTLLLELVASYTKFHPTNQKLLLSCGTLLAENPLEVGGEGIQSDPRFSHFFTYGNKFHPDIKGQISG
ncbi:MAG: hypothetical protein HQL72_09745 [Magnetococcales bacterium]|nr:hypothetical protein [Magnetococcales bacterium]